MKRASSSLRFCMVGLGRMGRLHLSTLRGLADRVTVTAAADSSPEVVKQAESGLGLTGYRDFARMLDREKPDAVVIATPPASHPELIEEAAARGIHIFCEKPLALGSEEGRRTAGALAKHGVRFQIGFQRRYDRAYLGARAQILSGAIGELITFKAVARDAWEPDLHYAKLEVSGGLLLDMAIHDYDLARWLMGSEVRRVSTEGNNLLYPQLSTVGDIDNAVVNLSFESGAIGNIEASRTGTYGYDIRTEVVGTRGAVCVGLVEDGGVVTAGNGGFRRRAVSGFEERFLDSYRLEVLDFVNCLLEDRPPECGIREGLLSLEIALAARESFRRGTPVDVPSLQDPA